jgi:predicted nucleic acid-binding Zn ribbon protein
MRKVADRDLPLQCNAEVWDDGDQRLTSCDAAMVRNKVAAPAFALKGKGWARDGYKG